jgi:YHS domain-containing protein
MGEIMDEKCPICGTQLSLETEHFEISYADKTVLLCSKECVTVFNLYPEAYAGEYEPELNLLEDTHS